MELFKKSLKEIVGDGYKEYWNFKGRYRVVKGGRGSKKSKTTALNFIYRMLQNKDINVLVVRKTYRTLKDSAYAELKFAIKTFSDEKNWTFKTSPLEIIYKKTGQKIFFRGLDDPMKINSISVNRGYLCFLWIEEAFEISSEHDFNMLDESIRGRVPDGLYKQITITLNPWSENHWIKKRFFDMEDPEILAITTTYLMNEFLDKKDVKVFESMKINNPKRYMVAGLGNWGISEGLIFENYDIKTLDKNQLLKSGAKEIYGLDFGYTNDPTALFCGIVSQKEKYIYVFDEIYEKKLSNKMIYENICIKKYKDKKIIADCSEPKSIDNLREFGLNIYPARKGADSIINGITNILDYKIIIDPNCKNFINEISSYTWDTNADGNKINKPIDKNNHLLDAFRYAMEQIMKGATFSFD